MLTLYDFSLSGNCYKIRLFLALIDKEYQIRKVDLRGGETTTPSFLRLNPRGQVPVIEDDGLLIWDSMAILIYLARRFADERWFPIDPVEQARVMQWMAVAENEILYGLARARAIRLFNRPFDADECKATGIAALQLLDGHLHSRDWLACDRPTIADIACYPYVALANEGGIDLGPYMSVRAWMNRIRSLPGYVALPGND